MFACLQVVLTANSGPTINDITAAELQPLLSAAAKGDELLGASLASGQLRVMSSGNDMPVIDLSQVGVDDTYIHRNRELRTAQQTLSGWG